jgi:hypothetical protein
MRRLCYPKGQDIQTWMESLSMTELIDHTRYAGQHRWRYSSAFDRKVAGNSLLPYRLTRSEALRRLALANAAKVRLRAGTLNLSNRPRIRGLT